MQQDEADEHLFMVPNGYKKMAEEYKAKAKDSSVEHFKMKEGHTVCWRKYNWNECQRSQMSQTMSH